MSKIESMSTAEIEGYLDTLDRELAFIADDLRSSSLTRYDETELLKKRDEINYTMDLLEKELDYRSRSSRRDDDRDIKRKGLGELYGGTQSTTYGSSGSKYSKGANNRGARSINIEEPRKPVLGTINDKPITEHTEENPVEEAKNQTKKSGPSVADAPIYVNDELYPYLTCDMVKEALVREGNKIRRVLKGLDINPKIPRLIKVEDENWLSAISDNSNEIKYTLRKVSYVETATDFTENFLVDPTMVEYSKIRSHLSTVLSILWAEEAVVNSINRLALMMLINHQLISIGEYAKYISELADVKTELLNNIVRAIKSLKIETKDGKLHVYREMPTVLGCPPLENAIEELETHIIIEGQYKAFQISKDSFPSVMLPLMAIATEYGSSVMELITSTGVKYSIFIIDEKAVIERNYSVCS